MNDLETLRAEWLDRIGTASAEPQLEEYRVAALGKKGEISLKMRELGKMTPEERQVAGPALNALKDEVNAALIAKKAGLADVALDERLKAEWLDVTLPARHRRQGTIHPVSQVMEEVTAIFADMGFSVAEGPQIETDFYNFDALNIPGHHPARAEMDTFYTHRAPRAITARPHVLRTHTSPVQIRHMEAHGAPCRVIAPGRVYRADYDQTHTPMFHQVEGLAIDRDISMAQLKWVLEEFYSAFFGTKVHTRFRASHFPFVEPGAEVDIQCSFEGGTVKVGEGDDWLEILGSGMVHPHVLKSAGVDPEVYQGFAFGMGIDRIAMLKYGIPDLRDFFASDLRWLRHYGFSALQVPSVHAGV